MGPGRLPPGGRIMNVCSWSRAWPRPVAAYLVRAPAYETILVTMGTVSISELKANLSRCLREVRRGGEVQVLDRGAPVAKLVPAAATGDDGVRERLIGAGLLRPGNGAAASILDEPTLALPVSVSEALIEDRTDRVPTISARR